MAEVLDPKKQNESPYGDAEVIPAQIRPNEDTQSSNDGASGSTGGGAQRTEPPANPWEDVLSGLGDEAQYTTPGSIDQNAEIENQRAFEANKVRAQQDALVDIEALDAEYQRLLGSLRGQYQTSETAQEKERLRFMLADIEAQYEAGVEAISSLYSETTAKLNNQARDYRSGIEGRAGEVESAFTQLASQAVDRNLARREGLAEQYRGYGIASGYDPRDASTDFLASLAPIQGNYSRMMGESTAAGIDFIAGMAEMQGLAQQGDLKRLAAATRTSAIQTHQAQVDARIQAERAAARGDRMQMQMAALSARQNAMDLNARLMSQAIQAEQYVPGQNVGQRYTEMTNLATNLGQQKVEPSLFASSFVNQFGGTPPPEFREMYIAQFHSAAINEINMLQDNLRRLELPEAETLAQQARIAYLDGILNQFGLLEIPTTEPAESGS